MNFSLKKTAKRPQRLQLETAATEREQELVTKIEQARPQEPVIELASGDWREALSARHERHLQRLEQLREAHPAASDQVIEDLALEDEVGARPDAPDLATYENMSVDAFGAALRRAIGQPAEISPPKSEFSIPKSKPRHKDQGVKIPLKRRKRDNSSIA